MIRGQVSEHHADLIQKATSIDKLDGVVKTLNGRVESLAHAVARIQQRISTPHTTIVTRLKQLERLQSACETLRRSVRFVYLAKRLRVQVEAGTRDLAKVCCVAIVP